MTTLTTFADVLRVLGGASEVVRILGYSSHTYISECAGRGRFPANTFDALQEALRLAGERDGVAYVAPASLWQQRPLVSAPAERPAA